MKILIIEDDIDIQESIRTYLVQQGFVCEVASTRQEAEDKIQFYQYDCLIVDLMLPDGTGIDTIRLVKKQRIDTGILILTAKNSLEDKLEGLELGADDYLTKPFHLSELNARIKAIIRRRYFNGDNLIKSGNLQIDLRKRFVFVNDSEIILTKKEYELLLYFIINKNSVLSKASLAEHCWGDNIDQTDSFDFLFAHIKNLKKKLNTKNAELEIQNIYGIGYKLVEK
jgi:DNA-binding response OmpR family regulator